MRRRPDGEPGELVWLLAVVSMALPWAGIGLGIIGGVELGRGNRVGYLWLAAGAALVILDVLIDFVWAKHVFSTSDEPSLNTRGGELVGRDRQDAARCTPAIRCGWPKAPTRPPVPPSALLPPTPACWWWSGCESVTPEFRVTEISGVQSRRQRA